MELCPLCRTKLDTSYPFGPTCWVERCPACGYEGGGTVSFAVPEDPNSDQVVSGFFQLESLAQYLALRSLLPSLSSMPSAEIIGRLRGVRLRWWVAPLKMHQARRYQEEAQKFGLEFVVTDVAADS